jgi:hypothetical protein
MKSHKNFFRLLPVLLLVFFFSCKGQTYTLDSLPSKRIEFGNEGGFTGAKTTYILLENGQVFSKTALVQTELEKVKKKEAKKVFKEMENLVQTKFECNETSNLTNFLVFYDGKESKEWKWPGGQIKPAPDALLELNKLILEIIKSNKDGN